ALCNAWRPFAVNDVPTAEGLTTVELRDRNNGTSTLDPWPFPARRVEVRCEARRLEARYADEAAMQRAFERAEPTPLTFEPPAPGSRAPRRRGRRGRARRGPARHPTAESPDGRQPARNSRSALLAPPTSGSPCANSRLSKSSSSRAPSDSRS